MNCLGKILSLTVVITTILLTFFTLSPLSIAKDKNTSLSKRSISLVKKKARKRCNSLKSTSKNRCLKRYKKCKKARDKRRKLKCYKNIRKKFKAEKTVNKPLKPEVPEGSIRLENIAWAPDAVEIKEAPGYPEFLFIVKQSGQVLVMNKNTSTILEDPFIDVSSLISNDGERGLLSIAFPQDYRTTGKFYLYYVVDNGDINISEFKRSTGSNTTADLTSRRLVISIPHRDAPNHNGGQMHFLGESLYFATGDGGTGGDEAQNKNSLLGKLIKINPRVSGDNPYSIPNDNPFVGKTGRDEIYAIGLRNPFRWSFDKKAGQETRIAIADVGQNEYEEVNYLPLSKAKGANFGWNYYEGYALYEGPFSNTVKPSFVQSHEAGNCSVIGGGAVHKNKPSILNDRYVFSDYCRGIIMSAPAKTGIINPAEIVDHGINGGNMTSFEVTESGDVYTTSSGGDIGKIVEDIVDK